MASRIAARVQRIKPSPSSAASERAAELRRQGRDIISFALGEPDFDTPEPIRRAACEAIERGETRYTATAGTPALREAIAAKLLKENGLAYGAKEIIVTCGAKHAIFNALAVTLDAGDEVIVPAPYWVSYPDMTLANDGTPVIVPCGEAQGFKLRGPDLEAAITAKTKWLILNSPSNPTGATYSAAELRAVADVLLRHPQVMLLADDIYEHIRFDGTTPDQRAHILAIEPQLRSRTMVINGVSKTYAMTGWRIGYAAGPADLIAAMDMLQSQSTSNASSVSQAAALAALRGDQAVVPQWSDVYRQRVSRAANLINAVPGLGTVMPGGAFYLFVNCSGLIGRRTADGQRLDTDIAVSLYLLESAGVAVVAGSAFGLSPYFRISIATSMELIEEGCRRIARAVSGLRA
jgi:aspartate aminotransferase